MPAKSNHSNITVSIFYSRSAWHDLIASAIKPFIYNEQNKNTDMTYYIYLCTNQGEHVTVVLQRDKENKLEQKFIKYIEKFISKNKSTTKAIEYPLPGFFMDYPNNSVWADIDNLYTFSPIECPSNIRYNLSQILIDALGDSEIETETIYTFLIYMQLGIIKSAYPAIKTARNGAIILLKYLSENEYIKQEVTIESQEYDYEDIKLSFENNKEILLEIIDDIWNAEGYQAELKWVELWVNSCRQIFKNSDLNKSFIYLNDLVHDHIGLGNKNLPGLSSKLILSSFIQLSKSLLNSTKVIRIA